MGDTDWPGGDGRHSGREGHNGRNGYRAASPVSRARSLLSEKYYRSLLQLAALLTGDAAVAEAVVADAFAAITPSAALGCSADDCLRDLRRLVLMRCRARRHCRQSVRRGQQTASDFARLPVVKALLGLPQSAREAVVLIHYLDLPAPQAAAIAGVSEALLTANLAAAMAALDDHLTGLCPDS